MTNILFDLDGTLIDSAPDIHAAATKLLREKGQEPLDLETIRGFIGNGVPVLVERIMRVRLATVAPELHADWTGRFMAHYEAAPAELTRLYPGVADALSALVGAGHRLALCTNKPAAVSRDILNALGVLEFFGAIIGGDTLPERKPDPAPLRAAVEALGGGTAIYVGDSEIDAKAASAAGLPFLLYTRGYAKVPLEEIDAAVSFDGFEALPSLVERFAAVSEASAPRR